MFPLPACRSSQHWPRKQMMKKNICWHSLLCSCDWESLLSSLSHFMFDFANFIFDCWVHCHFASNHVESGCFSLFWESSCLPCFKLSWHCHCCCILNNLFCDFCFDSQLAGFSKLPFANQSVFIGCFNCNLDLIFCCIKNCKVSTDLGFALMEDLFYDTKSKIA